MFSPSSKYDSITSCDNQMFGAVPSCFAMMKTVVEFQILYSIIMSQSQARICFAFMIDPQERWRCRDPDVLLCGPVDAVEKGRAAEAVPRSVWGAFCQHYVGIGMIDILCIPISS
jgi:hypothetical protein